MAPAGVTLIVTTLAVTSLSAVDTAQQMNDSYARSLEAAKAMARAGANVVVLGGNPINQSRGIKTLKAVCARLAEEIGTKVVTSSHSQMRALHALGARKVAPCIPSAPTRTPTTSDRCAISNSAGRCHRLRLFRAGSRQDFRANWR